MTTKEITLTRGFVTIVDEADYEWLNQWKWHIKDSEYDDCLYAVRKPSTGTIRMHRLLLNAPEGIEVDHRDGNGLNNCRSNLRLATPSQQKMNKCAYKTFKGKPCASKYKGVWFSKELRKKKWVMEIKIDNKKVRKRFITEIEAALAYNEMASKYFGEFARLNVI